MKTTTDIRKLANNSPSVSAFVSNLPGRKTRVSIVDNPAARTYHDGHVLFQQVYSQWNRVPERDYLAISSILNGLDNT